MLNGSLQDSSYTTQLSEVWKYHVLLVSGQKAKQHAKVKMEE